MTSQKKIYRIVIFAVSAVVLIVAGLTVWAVSSYRALYYDGTYNIEARWDITLPDDLTLLYKCQLSGWDMWFGEGVRYYVYAVGDSAVPFFETDALTTPVPEEEQETIRQWLTRIRAEQDQYPDFSAVSSWKRMDKWDHSNLFFLYDSDDQKVFVVENVR